MAFGTEPEDHGDSGSNGADLRNTISTLTHRLANLGKPADGGDRAMGIFLAGANKGAVMKADLLDEAMEKGGNEKLNAYTNSNYQSVNNSIMIDGNCHAEDPGIHIEIVDYVEDVDIEEEDDHHEKKKKAKKDKKEVSDDGDEGDHREKEGKKEKKEKKEKKGKSHGDNKHSGAKEDNE